MDAITIVSFIVTAIGSFIGGIALYKQYLDKPRLKKMSINPGISGSKGVNDDVWKHHVSSIEIVILNKGARPAIDCEGIITFHNIDPMPLYPQTREHTVDVGNRVFSINPMSKIRLVGAWQYSSGGVINGTVHNYSLGEFAEKAAPFTVTIKYGEEEKSFTVSRESVKEYFTEYQKQQNTYAI